MEPPEIDLAERVRYLEKYTNTLHMVLDNFVQRIRKVEAATGLDEEGINQTLEWRATIEATLLKNMHAQNWHWQDSDDPLVRSQGDVAYKHILKLLEMLPVDVQMKCWNQVDVPADLPLVWSEASPTHTSGQVAEHLKDQTDRKLVKKLREIRKHAK